MSKKWIVYVVSILVIALVLGAGYSRIATAWEIVYGDIIMTKNKEAMKKAEVGAVIFPHWFHRIRFKCKVCHIAIFKMKKGANDIDMEKISSGKHCGVCHDGKVAWDPLYCDRCHAIPWDSDIIKKIETEEKERKARMKATGTTTTKAK